MVCIVAAKKEREASPIRAAKRARASKHGDTDADTPARRESAVEGEGDFL